MSAFVVSKEHVDLLVDIAINGPSGRVVSPSTAWHTLSWYTERGLQHEARRETADDVGQMLVAENLASVRHRYAHSDPESMIPEWAALPYRFTRQPYRMTAAEAIMAIRCYEYQSCEHPGWQKSEAHQFCSALVGALLFALPEVDAAPWAWDAEEIAKRTAVHGVHVLVFDPGLADKRGFTK